MYLIKLAVEVLATDRALGILFNKDAVVVLETDLVTAMARLKVATDASVMDSNTRWKALSVNTATDISLTRVKDFLIALIKLEVVVDV